LFIVFLPESHAITVSLKEAVAVMNYLGNELVFLENDRVNYWPDRRDRAVKRPVSPDKKVCRPDRFVSQYNNDFYNGWKHH
jgi:hypothetical protein